MFYSVFFFCQTISSDGESTLKSFTNVNIATNIFFRSKCFCACLGEDQGKFFDKKTSKISRDNVPLRKFCTHFIMY
jgi:hypothetical protein